MMRTWKQMIHRKQPWISMACLAMVLLLLFSAAPWGVQASPAEQLAVAANSWSNRNPANPPPARAKHAMAYAENAWGVILFGGVDNGSLYLNDTWAYSYSANTWSNRGPGNPPPARGYHALAFDSANNKVILFGGWNGSSLNDTWAYDYVTNTWSNRNPANPPPARYSHALAYDSANHKVILFGGRGGSSLNDTWAYDYVTNTWSNRGPIGPPPARARHAMAYDYYSGKTILFGGWNGSSLNDTWAYDYAANTWVSRNPENPPPARFEHALAYSVGAGKVILFGGWNGSNPLNAFNDTWVYDYAVNFWTNCNPANSPPARFNHAMVYTGKVVLFGGWNGSSLNDTWAYDYSGIETVIYTLQANWNMISLPLVPTSTDPLAVFGGLPSPWYLFRWDPLAGTYIGKELIVLDPKVGYWLKVPTAVNYPVCGAPNGEAQTWIDLGLGWNLIGVPYQGTIPWGAVRVSRDGWVYLVTLDQAVSSDWIQGMFFHWNGSAYDILTSGGNFQSTFGYWVKAKLTGLHLVFLKP